MTLSGAHSNDLFADSQTFPAQRMNGTAQQKE